MSTGNVIMRSLLACSVAAALSVPVFAQDQALVPVGEMRCSSALEPDEEPTEVDLDCEVTFTEEGRGPFQFDGTLIGTDLYLVEPGPEELVWDVLMMSDDAELSAMQGVYDIESTHAVATAGEMQRVIFGGQDDTVGLRLREPGVDEINPSTRLTLELP